MSLLSILLFLIIACALFWFGYTLFFRIPRPGPRMGRSRLKDSAEAGGDIEGSPGAPQTCPVCTAKLPPGRLVKSAVYPSQNGRDRIMHIMGCPYCLEGEDRRRRLCPVCHKPISDTEYLYARVFERPGKSHVHVLGCVNCRGPKAMR
ncbi:MAG: hypothetical protein LBF63_10180 [Treponema sp.]|jgi:hypothetical protein|nr:hypothetical protein [Treponema sp.]